MPRCANLMVVALLMAAVSRMSGQGDDPKNSLQQRLNAQFALTKITADRSDIVTTGTLCSSSLGREVWIAVLCSAIPSPHWNSCRPRATSFGNNYRPVPTHLGTTGRQRPQGAEPQGGLQHGARPRSRKRLSTPDPPTRPPAPPFMS